MLSRASADSKRYKSVVDLQKNALYDLQKDYNKAIVDLSYTANISEERNYPVISENNLPRTYDSSEIIDKQTFSNTILGHIMDRSSPEEGGMDQYRSVKEGRLAVIKSQTNQYSNSLLKDLVKEQKRRGEHTGNKVKGLESGDIQGVYQSQHLSEKTFDHGIPKFKTGHRHNISLTEGSSNKKSVMARYECQMGSKPNYKIESKRMSTEHLVEVFPQDYSPEIITDQTEDSFISNTTVKNSPVFDIEGQRDGEYERFRRSQSRGESRILIQALPKLYTKSKYEDFRQAKSIDRKEFS